jgi:serine/threonine protein kinase
LALTHVLVLYSPQVDYLSSIRHRNLVNLLGYCQDNGMQMLVYEYIPNGSVSTHLYGNLIMFPVITFMYKLAITSCHLSALLFLGKSQAPGAKIEFKQRISIAHGTAKGTPSPTLIFSVLFRSICFTNFISIILEDSITYLILQ